MGEIKFTTRWQIRPLRRWTREEIHHRRRELCIEATLDELFASFYSFIMPLVYRFPKLRNIYSAHRLDG